MSNNYDVSVNSFNAKLNSIPDDVSTHKSEASANSVMAASTKSNKKKSLLTPELEAYVRSKGIDPATLTDMDIVNYTEELNNQKNLNLNNRTVGSQKAVSDPQNAVETESSHSSQVPVPEKKLTVATTQATSVANTVVGPSKLSNSSIKIELKLDDPDMESFVIDSFHSDDILLDDEALKNGNDLVEDDARENCFVDNLVKVQFSKDYWNKLSPEEQDNCYKEFRALFNKEDVKGADFISFIQDVAQEEWNKLTPADKLEMRESVEKQLSEEVVGWNTLKSEEKIQLARIFLTDGNAVKIRENVFGDKHVPLTVQIQKSIKSIKKIEDISASAKETDAQVLDFLVKEKGFTGTSLSEYEGDVTAARLEYYKSVGEDNLTKYQKMEYEDLKVAEDFLRKVESRKRGSDYSGEVDFSRLGEVSRDPLNNTRTDIMLSDHYKNNKNENEEVRFKEATKEFLEERLSNTCKIVDGKYIDSNGQEIKKEDAVNLWKETIAEISNNSFDYRDKLLFASIVDEVIRENKGSMEQVREIETNEDLTIQALSAERYGDRKTQEATIDRVVVAARKHPYKFDSDALVLADRVKKGKFQKMEKGYGAVQFATVGRAEFDKASHDITASIEDPNTQYEVNKQIFENTGVSSETKVYYTDNTDKMDESVHGKIHDAALQVNDANVTEAAARVIPKINVNQPKALEKVMNASTRYDKEDAIRIQNTAVDQIKDYKIENQAAAHKIAMTSEYEEVLERATSNIQYYDASVQEEALEVSAQVGIDRGSDVVQKAVAEQANKIASDSSHPASKSVSSNATIQNVVQSVEKAVVKEVAHIVANGLAEIDAPTNVDTKREAAIKHFKEFMEADPQTQFKMLDKLPESMKKQVYIMLAKFRPMMLTGLISQGYGIQIAMTPGLPAGVRDTILSMMEKDSKYKEDAYRFILKKLNKSSVDAAMYKRAEEYFMTDKEKKVMQSLQSAPTNFSTNPIIDEKFMNNTFASHFNDTNKKFYKNMPPIKG